MLIDAAAEPERLLELIGDGGLTTIVTTHQHWDHHRALAAVVEAAHRGPRSSPAPPTRTRSPSRPASRVDRRVGTGDTVAVGTCTLDVIPLAGHTPGSIALLLDDEPARRTRTCSPATRSSPAVSGNTDERRRTSPR